MCELAAHDLSNNLCAVRFALASLTNPDGKGGERPRRSVELIRLALGQMEQLVTELRDPHRRYSGRFVLGAISPVAPDSLVSKAIELAAGPADGRTLTAACDDGLPPVLVDEVRIQRVFANLIANAIKFTGPAGVITVGAKAGPTPRWVTCFVRDDGEGIAALQQGRVFEPHWQAEPGRRGGQGLGLTICRGIVEAHGGRLSVASQPGSGSTFSFTLPTSRGWCG